MGILYDVDWAAQMHRFESWLGCFSVDCFALLKLSVTDFCVLKLLADVMLCFSDILVCNIGRQSYCGRQSMDRRKTIPITPR